MVGRKHHEACPHRRRPAPRRSVSSPPPAQAQTGTARGKVFDAQGQPVADAKIVIEYQGGITRKFEIKTNKKGEYMQVGMQPGPYRITASKDGFQPAVIEVRIVARRPHRGPRLQAR